MLAFLMFIFFRTQRYPPRKGDFRMLNKVYAEISVSFILAGRVGSVKDAYIVALLDVASLEIYVGWN